MFKVLLPFYCIFFLFTKIMKECISSVHLTFWVLFSIYHPYQKRFIEGHHPSFVQRRTQGNISISRRVQIRISEVHLGRCSQRSCRLGKDDRKAPSPIHATYLQTQAQALVLALVLPLVLALVLALAQGPPQGPALLPLLPPLLQLYNMQRVTRGEEGCRGVKGGHGD